MRYRLPTWSEQEVRRRVRPVGGDPSRRGVPVPVRVPVPVPVRVPVPGPVRVPVPGPVRVP